MCCSDSASTSCGDQLHDSNVAGWLLKFPSLPWRGALLSELFRTKLQPYFSASVLHQKKHPRDCRPRRVERGRIPTILSLVHGKVQHNPVIQPSPVFGFLHELTELRIGDRCLIYAVCLSQASLRTSTSRFPVFKGILPNGRMTRKRPIWGFP